MTSIVPRAPSSRQADSARLFALTGSSPLVGLNTSALNENIKLPAFYCVHSITGTVGEDYAPLAERLNHVVRFYGVQAPYAKLVGETFGRSVDEMVDFYTKALVKAQPTEDFLLGGWSAGALIALEIAQRLRGVHGREVALLVSMDGTFKNLPPRFVPKQKAYVWGVLRNVPAWTHDALFTHKMSLPLRLKQRGVKGLKRILRRDVPPVESAVDTAHPVERFRSYEEKPILRPFIMRLYDPLVSYEHKAYDGEVVVYQAKLTSLYHVSDVGRAWKAVAPRAKVKRVSGDHHTLIREPHVAGLAHDLAQRIPLLRTSMSIPKLSAHQEAHVDDTQAVPLVPTLSKDLFPKDRPGNSDTGVDHRRASPERRGFRRPFRFLKPLL